METGNDDGFLKLSKTREWLLGDNSAPINKKPSAKVNVFCWLSLLYDRLALKIPPSHLKREGLLLRKKSPFSCY